MSESSKKFQDLCENMYQLHSKTINKINELDESSGVGQKTDANGEIFNDYTNNNALGEYSHVEGYDNDTNVSTAHVEGQLNDGLVKAYHILSQSVENPFILTLDSVENIEANMQFNIFVQTEEGLDKYRGTIGSVDSENNTVTLSSSEYSNEMFAGIFENHVFDIENKSLIMNLIVNGGKVGSFNVIDTTNNFSQHIEGKSNFAGLNGHAEGYGVSAIGYSSHAEGYFTTASGERAHSEGYRTIASGNESHAEGTRSVAKGEASHAEGLRTIASSNNSHAQGENTKAGTKGFKIASSFTNDGSGTIKFNLNSSEGLNDNLIGTPCTLRVANEFSNGITISGYDTTASTITLKGVPADATYETDSDDASTHTVENFIVIQGHPELGDTDVGHNAHAGGYNTLAQGRETFAAGRDNKVVGQYGAVTGRENIVGHGAFASGRKNTALGTMSHAEGSETKAIGSCAHAEGKNTESYGTYSHAEGSYTKAHGDFTHSEGYRSTASGEAAHAEGGDTTAEGNYSHAEGYSSYAKGINTHSEGNNTYAEGSASHAEGTDSQSVGQSSHAEGRGTLANGTNSHSEGNSTKARGNHSHAEGVKSRTGNADNTGGYAAHAEGNETEATGSSSHSEGNQTHATASCSHAEGNNTYASGSASHAEGAYTIAASAYQHVQGKYNVVDSEGTYAHIIGNGTGNADDQRKNIHTVDWNGNAWFASEITVGEDKKKLVTEDKLSEKADKATTLAGYGITDSYSKPEIDSKLSSVYKYRGTKDYYFQLPTEKEVGDVYNIRYASGENYEEKPVSYSNYNIYENQDLNGFYIHMDFFNKPSFMNKETLTINIFSLLEENISKSSFSVPILDSRPETITSCAFWDSGYLFIYVIKTEAPFNEMSIDGYDTKYDEIYDYITNTSSGVQQNAPLQFNYEQEYSLEEPYKVKDGDNVAWTGTEWDVLAGTEDMSLYEQTENKVTHIDENSTDDQYPTAKAVWRAAQTLIEGVNEAYVTNNSFNTQIELFNTAHYDKTEVDGKLESKADKSYVDSKLSSVYRYKGTKDYYFELPQSSEVGDVYNIKYASGENYYTEDKLYGDYTVDSSSNIPPFSDYGLEGLAVTIPMSLNDFNNLKAQGDTVIVDISVDYRFEIPIRDDCPAQATSCLCRLDDSNAFLIIVSTEEPFNQENAYFETFYLAIKSRLEDVGIPSLQFNESVDIYPLEPYLVNAGDNVAWTGSEWDKLASTVDLSNYAEKATTLEGYGITDSYTKDEVNTLIATGSNAVSSIILNSSTEGSDKQFRITIDDNGTLTATAINTEVNE